MPTSLRSIIGLIIMSSFISLAFLPSSDSSNQSLFDQPRISNRSINHAELSPIDYKDFLKISIYKHWISATEVDAYFFSEQTLSGTPTQIYQMPESVRAYDPNYPETFKEVWVHGFSQNFGHRMGMIFVRGTWVVVWRVRGYIGKDCSVKLTIDEFYIPGLEFGSAPAFGIEEVNITKGEFSGKRIFEFGPHQSTASQTIQGPAVLPGGVYTVVLETYRVPDVRESEEVTVEHFLPRCHFVDLPTTIDPQNPRPHVFEDLPSQMDTVSGNVDWPSTENWSSGEGYWTVSPVASMFGQ